MRIIKLTPQFRKLILTSFVLLLVSCRTSVEDVKKSVQDSLSTPPQDSAPVPERPAPKPPVTNPAPAPAPTSPPPVATPAPAPTKPKAYAAQIAAYAGISSCRQFSFADRGRPPLGYLKGMALTYARSLCRIRATGSPKPGALIMKAASSGNAAKDVLAHFQDILARVGLPVHIAGDEAVHATYSIGIGLAMRESSGRYCVGWDEAAGANRGSQEAEAGLFQASLDSMKASPELRKLYNEYKANPSRCLLEVYKEGVSCKTQSILGTGEGAEFQEFTKRCPAFSAEYVMTLVRILRAHFGPLNRQTAQVVPQCESMLSYVRQVVNQDPEGVCNELF